MTRAFSARYRADQAISEMRRVRANLDAAEAALRSNGDWAEAHRILLLVETHARAARRYAGIRKETPAP